MSNPMPGITKASSTIRVFVPPNVANNLESMQKVTANLLGRLGCPGCHSGWNIRFQQETDFVVNSKLEAIGAHTSL